jgi:DNA topoisomerase I
VKLVVVESPAKAKTIEKYLGGGHRVLASYGHVRDLPPKDGSVDPEHDFDMLWQVSPDRSKQLKIITDEAKKADTLILATDPDREGEAISWHVQEVLRQKKALPQNVQRVTFNAITNAAVSEAMRNPRGLDEDLIDAYRARRALDYLVGFTLSPILWRKLPGAKSAGRVQSVALRLIVDREREIEVFKTQEYWQVNATFEADGQPFTARLVQLDGKKLDRLSIGSKGEADAAKATVEAGRFTVASVETKPFAKNPPPPFTTSTLQQEAARKLGFSASHTMRVAQSLYEDGLITYMRTDGVDMAEEAISAARKAIANRYDSGFVPDKPRRYTSKAKNAQEAHEAIRPSNFRDTPASMESTLDRHDLRLYELIWKRTMASQMVDARVLRTTVEISGQGANGETAVFTASGKAIEFAGFRRAYVEGSDDPAAELEEQETVLPKMAVGDRVARESSARLHVVALDPKRHETSPPARYTEASLIKELERQGIGRPSTYAATIGTIERRGYIFRQGKALVPSFTAFAVTHLLRGHFGDLIDVAFTAEMEEDLDQISRGERDWLDFIKEFYRGDKHHRGLEDAVKQAEERADYPLIDVGVDPESGEPVRVRIGRYGPFLQLGEGGPGRTASLPPMQPPADLAVDKAMALIKAKAEGPRVLGTDPKTGMNVYAIHGRFGAYVQLGETPDRGSKEKPKRSSLIGGQTESTVTLEEALKLLELPREIGTHPESGQPVLAGLGRFGPYVKHGDDYRSLANDDELFTVSLERALELFAQPKRGGRRQMTRRVIRQIEATDKGAPLQVLEGRYGPYVTDGEINASIPRGMDPATLSLDDARGLIEARRGAAPRVARGGRPAPKRRGARAAKAVEPPPVAPKARAARPAPKRKAASRKPSNRKAVH